MRETTIISLESVDSTSDYLKRHHELWNGNTVVHAREQIKGRGRLNRTWASNPGLDLTFSFVVTPGPDISPVSAVSIIAGIALYRVMANYCAGGLGLKWPNDLYHSGRKLAGILCELVYSDRPHVIIGIGMNVNSRTFSRDIAGQATSLAMITGREHDILKLMREIVASSIDLIGSTTLPLEQHLIDEWNNASALTGAAVNYFTGGMWRKGVVLSIDGQGCLVVCDTVAGKEVALCGDIPVIQD
ncbi:MAG TPA: biotin--[acetyl-CoA-carboxylase] ligase [Spirochaetota bacterium]|nr:biotin--[acetyl-CoA-carboxylase] ligase [Spirochaetota bacterium]HPI87692.1 biotin--[acetyl-CoA-carboxylase] ligase [Spirochaetota bacterium]HPR48183.1 biotin--[acetyl-CoA-carboxylase] ligase [Spirochaetota bacterium]